MKKLLKNALVVAVFLTLFILYPSGWLLPSARAAAKKPEIKLTVCKVFTKGGKLKYTYLRHGKNLTLNGKTSGDQLGMWDGTTVAGIRKRESGTKVQYFFVGLKINTPGNGSVKGPYTLKARAPDSRYQFGQQHGMTYKCFVGPVVDGKAVN